MSPSSRCGGPTFESPGRGGGRKGSGGSGRVAPGPLPAPHRATQLGPQFPQLLRSGAVPHQRHQDSTDISRNSHSDPRESCRLTQLRCWVVPGRDSSSSASSGRRVPSLHSKVRLRRVYTCLLFLHTSAGKNPARSVPGRQEAAVPAAGADSVSHRRSALRHSPPPRIRAACHRLRREDSARPDGQEPSTFVSAMSRPGSGPGGRLPSHNVGLFRCSREPCVSLPRRSRARRPSRCQTASRATLHSLRSFRALGHWETLSRASARMASKNETTSPASPTRLRDSQQPRPTKRLTLPPHQDNHRHLPPEGEEKV